MSVQKSFLKCVVLAVATALGAGYWACSSTDDTADISKALSDRLTDKLTFDNGTIVDGEPPVEHAGDSAYPQIDLSTTTMPIAVELASPFTINLTTTTVTTADGAVVYVKQANSDHVATKYIEVTAPFDGTTMSLTGTLEQDEVLLGSSFAIQIAMFNEQGAGNYISWNMVISGGTNSCTPCETDVTVEPAPTCPWFDPQNPESACTAFPSVVTQDHDNTAIVQGTSYPNGTVFGDEYCQLRINCPEGG